MPIRWTKQVTVDHGEQIGQILVRYANGARWVLIAKHGTEGTAIQLFAGDRLCRSCFSEAADRDTGGLCNHCYDTVGEVFSFWLTPWGRR